MQALNEQFFIPALGNKAGISRIRKGYLKNTLPDKIFSMKPFLLCLVAVTSLWTHPTVELVSIYPETAHWMKRELTKHNFQGTIIFSDLTSYKGLKKDKAHWARLLKKCGIHLNQKIPLKEGISKIVFFNVDAHYQNHFDLQKLPKEKMVLFMW